MQYCRCGEEIQPGRVRLGIHLCLRCGEAAAQLEIIAKGQRVAPDGNKQGYSYQGDPATARRNILQAGKKQESVVLNNAPTPTIATAGPPPAAVRQRFRRRQIGVYYVGTQAYVWFEGEDPAAKGATRTARFPER